MAELLGFSAGILIGASYEASKRTRRTLGVAMRFDRLTRTRKALGLIVLAALAIGNNSAPAQAGYIATLAQVGSDVVASGSGTIDLTNLSPQGASPFAASIAPSSNII